MLVDMVEPKAVDKNKGSSTQPCGTPKHKLTHIEVTSSTVTACVCCERHDLFTAVCGVTYVAFEQFVEKQTVIDNIEGGTKIEQHQYYGLPIIQQMKPVIRYTNKGSFTTVSRTIRTEDFEDIVRVHVLPDLRCDFLLEKF